MARKPIQNTGGIGSLILTVRGARVMLDTDLAQFYGVELKRLNEQVRRNSDRFPESFAFQLTRQEVASLQSGSSQSKKHGGARKLPWVFTEHGALQLAGVLNSATAVQASIRIVEAFIAMREQLAAHKELASKLAELESRVSGHDQSIQDLFEAIRQLVEPAVEKTPKEIGFHIRETAPPYRVRSKKRF